MRNVQIYIYKTKYETKFVPFQTKYRQRPRYEDTAIVFNPDIDWDIDLLLS